MPTAVRVPPCSKRLRVPVSPMAPFRWASWVLHGFSNNSKVVGSSPLSHMHGVLQPVIMILYRVHYLKGVKPLQSIRQLLICNWL